MGARQCYFVCCWRETPFDGCKGGLDDKSTIAGLGSCKEAAPRLDLLTREVEGPAPERRIEENPLDTSRVYRIARRLSAGPDFLIDVSRCREERTYVESLSLPIPSVVISSQSHSAVAAQLELAMTRCGLLAVAREIRSDRRPSGSRET